MSKKHLSPCKNKRKNKEFFKNILSMYKEMVFNHKSSKYFRFTHKDALDGSEFKHDLHCTTWKGTFKGKIQCRNCNSYKPRVNKFAATECTNCKESSDVVYKTTISPNSIKTPRFNATIGFERQFMTTTKIGSQYVISDATCTGECSIGNTASQKEYFSNDGDLTIVCEVTLPYQKHDDEAGATDIREDQPVLMNIIAGMFTNENIDPPSKNDCLGDIVLVVGDHKIQCHKFILAATSKVFKKMLTTDMQEKNSAEIVLHDINLSTAKSLLSFMYSEKVDNCEITTDLLAAADFYEVPLLKAVCKSHLLKILDFSNVAQIWLCGYLHSDVELECKTIAFMARHWEELLEDEQIQTLVDEYPDLTYFISKLLSVK